FDITQSKAEIRSVATKRNASPKSKISRTLPLLSFFRPGNSKVKTVCFVIGAQYVASEWAARVVQYFCSFLSEDLCPKASIGIMIPAMVNLTLLRMRTFPTLLILAVSSLAAGAVTLNVDPAQSHITLSGTVAGFKLSEQGSGSLSTTVGGSVNVTVANGQIQIDSANLDPNTNGNWKPGKNGADSSPADLAGQATSIVGTITGALRDLVVNATSTAKPLDSNGKFDASSIVFAFPPNSTSVLDYNAGFLGAG